jgi:hypothetical protein
MWANLDVVEICHAIIFLLKILNFVVSRHNNLSLPEQNFGVRVHVAYQLICATTHI